MKQTREELLRHYEEQRTFLKMSSYSYDAGVVAEGKRLAHTIRTLVHDTSSSHSLLGLLGLKDSIDYCWVTGYELSKGEPIIYDGVPKEAGLSGRLRYVPNLGTPTHTTDFQTWWNGLLLINKVNNRLFTRKEVVLGVANKDGGSHVDPKLDGKYATLSRGNSIGWRNSDDSEDNPFENGPELPIVRTVAHELELSFLRTKQ